MIATEISSELLAREHDLVLARLCPFFSVFYFCNWPVADARVADTSVRNSGKFRHQ
jgi:hypothetical protein